MGATQPTQNETPVARSSMKTLAVRPLEDISENISSQPGIRRAMSMPVPIPMGQPNTIITLRSSAAPNAGRRDVNLLPIVVREIRRYHRDVLQSKEILSFTINPGDNFTQQPMNDPNWLQLTHPEGARYFFNPVQRVFTDEDVSEENNASEILNAAIHAKQLAAENGIVLSATVELVLEKLEKFGEGTFGYYFVDHDAQTLFWLTSFRFERLMNGVRGVSERSHIMYALEAQYWKHCALFPNMRVLCGHVFERLRDMAVYAHAESMISETSLSPFDLDELSKVLALLDQLKDSIDKENDNFVCIVARYMHIFILAKFINFCGQRGARLDADQSLYDSNDGKQHNLIFRILNVVLFTSPDLHIYSLRKVWVDKTVVKPRWKKFINQLNSEWNSFTVFSTVMLAVDVSFLAVPGVDDPTTPVKSPATIIIYMSTLCAMGSLVISLVLAGQVNNDKRSSAGRVAEFLT